MANHNNDQMTEEIHKFIQNMILQIFVFYYTTIDFFVFWFI